MWSRIARVTWSRGQGPGAARGQGRPGARGGQGRPGAARGDQGRPGAARGGQGRPEASRGGQGRPGAARASQGQPGGARGGQRRPGAARGSQGRPRAAKGRPRRPKGQATGANGCPKRSTWTPNGRQVTLEAELLENNVFKKNVKYQSQCPTGRKRETFIENETSRFEANRKKDTKLVFLKIRYCKCQLCWCKVSSLRRLRDFNIFEEKCRHTERLPDRPKT